MKELAAALVKAQGAMPDLQRDKINPAFRSRYLSLEKLLEEVLPVLNRHELAVTQWPTFVETETGVLPALRTILVHGPTGEQMQDTMLLREEKQTPQGQGSAITYAKRYALMALCGLSADEDDDGNTATGQRPRRQARATGGPKKITAAQRGAIFAAVRDAHIATAKATEIIKRVAGVDKSDDIPAEKYDAVIDAIRAAA